MVNYLKAVLVAGAALAAVAQVNAATITFSGLPQNNGDAFTGPYAEAGYTVSAVGGQVFEGHIFGNPQPSLVVGSVFGGGNTGSVEVMGPASFTLASFDLSAQNGDADYTVQGFINAMLQYTLTGSADAGFSTYTGSTTAVNRLVFTLNPTGTSVNLDNIVLDAAPAVPEPATWAMMICGFGVAGAAMRRQRAKVSFAAA